jgi:hypothetical protein
MVFSVGLDAIRERSKSTAQASIITGAIVES